MILKQFYEKYKENQTLDEMFLEFFKLNSELYWFIQIKRTDKSIFSIPCILWKTGKARTNS